MLKVNTLADVTVTTAGTRVQVTATATPVTSVTFQGKNGNTGVVYVGDSSVASTRGIALAASSAITFVADNSGRPGGEELDLSDFYVDAATNGDKVKVAYTTRK